MPNFSPRNEQTTPMHTMLVPNTSTGACIEYWQRSGQHCQQLTLICHFLSGARGPGHDEMEADTELGRFHYIFI